MKRNKIIHCFYATLMVFISLLLMSSCEKYEEIWYHNQYIFLEQHRHEQSELLEGECVHLLFDFPSYHFDSSTGILTDYGGNIEMNKSLIMVLGTGTSASGDASNGAATGLHEVQEIPDDHSNFKITKIDTDGTVYFSYSDSTIMLHTNEEWLNVLTKTSKQIDWNGDTLGTIKYTYTDRITNWGLLNKKAFVEIN